jgi:membrane protease YdiL (CAAX protease family)
MWNLAKVLLVVVTVGVTTFLGFQEKHAGTPTFFFITVSGTAVFAVYAVYHMLEAGEVRQRLFIRGGDFTLGTVSAAALFGAAFAFARFVAPLGTPRAGWLLRVYLQLGDPDLLRKKIALVWIAIALAAVAEEIVFRYLVPALLEEKVGSRYAWIVSAGLYALAHAPTAFAMRRAETGLNPLLPIAALGCGLVWGALARRTGRLLPSIFSHVLFDGVVVVTFRLYGPSV